MKVYPKVLITILFNLIFFSTTIHAANLLNKFAVVNIGQIFQQLPQMEVISKNLEQEFKERASALENMAVNLDTQSHQLQSNSLINSQKHKELEQELILQRKAFAAKIEDFENDKHRRQWEEQNKIINMIRVAVEQVAHNEKYDVVLDSNVILYADNLPDITEQVLKQIK
ncbi:MAG: OmpH family outer membrane protein [Candidatus Dasytiphilus stammeri]